MRKLAAFAAVGPLIGSVQRTAGEPASGRAAVVAAGDGGPSEGVVVSPGLAKGDDARRRGGRELTGPTLSNGDSKALLRSAGREVAAAG